ncbi:MAG: saccharopine dehydrogenase family protein [Actinomycetota bacterium]
MPDILLFGATGYTGKLTAHALYERGADFAVAGRDPEKLKELAGAVGNPEVRVAGAGDIEALTAALHDVKVMITCVGPFVELGWTAAEAALNAGVHYIDSTGEGEFIAHLLEQVDVRAQSAGIAMAPAMGFDEVPADVAATLATDGMDEPELALTYALPGSGSRGTTKSALGIVASKGPWIEDGRTVLISAGDHSRWSPMPPPLGPRQAASFPFSVGRLLPLHLELRSMRLYATMGAPQRGALRAIVPLIRAGHALPGGRGVLERAVDTLQRQEGPTDALRTSKWTILAEARDKHTWRNVALMGTDVYGLTASLLAAGAQRMAAPDYDRTGVVAPVTAMGLEWLEKRLADEGVSVSTWGPT